MLSKIHSAATVGLEGVLIRVEVDVAERGFPTFTIVGLPNKAIDESKERVRTAIRNSGFEMPDSKIVVNLAPADIPKKGSLFDLPIAVGILVSSRMIDPVSVKKSLFVGELSLDGGVRKVPGVLPISLLVKTEGLESLFVPKENAEEASLLREITVYPVSSLIDLILHLNGQKKIDEAPKISLDKIKQNTTYEFDFADIKGQEQAKRALEIAAAGFHNVHLKGPPGAGKTLLARSFPSIMPSMDDDEVIEVSKIYSVSGENKGSSFILTRPFRSPHHTISRVGLTGGGVQLTPGEISFAHRGVLFLDEFPEFPRTVVEALRQPLEDGLVSISRASGSITFPSRFLLIAASNPCPCGFLGHPTKPCKCGMNQVLLYRKRVSGPILDRIDIHLDVPPVTQEKLTQTATGEKKRGDPRSSSGGENSTAKKVF
jgi:magnesium chelatase family protein